MKTTHKLIAAALGMLGSLAMFLYVIWTSSCDTPVHRCTTEVSVLEDMTEAQNAKPNAAEIVSLFGLDTDKWNGATFLYSYMTDVSYNSRTKLVLPEGGARLTSSTFLRDKDVSRFRDSLDQFLASLASATAGRPNSSIYVPLAEELERLAKSPAQKKVLLVYSDLMDNEPGLSLYDKRTFALLQNEPEKFEAMLSERSTLGDFSGIEVYFIFQPTDAKSDVVFRTVSGFYKQLLEKHSAHVSIGANIPVSTNRKTRHE